MPKNASTNWRDVTSLAVQHDCLLLDLDGTVFRGHDPTEGAIRTLGGIGSRKLYVTNNASRSADDVAEHLNQLGFAATPDDVVTSAQSAARMLAERLEPGAKVLVVGTDALAAEITAVGLIPVRLSADGPVAVVQGLSMTIGWPDLAEAALAIRSGALWVTANLDPTLPTERGLVPGNGSIVAALRAATGAEPLVAGKPAPALMRDALARGHFSTPLVVGDRLDTDIAGAVAAGLPSLMVLTGVSTAAEAARANRDSRPTYIGADLRALNADATALAITEQPAWRVDLSSGGLTVTSRGNDSGDDGLSVIRAVACALWATDDPASIPVRAGDQTADAALRRWDLLGGGIG